MRANAPGSSQAQKGVVCTPNMRTARHPTSRPNNPPTNLSVRKQLLISNHLLISENIYELLSIRARMIVSTVIYS